MLFRDPEGGEDLIKRVVGVPEGKIAVRGGKLFLNGEPQKEPYVAHKTCSFGPATVPRGYVFVIGDNRAHSYDSRFFDPAPEETLIGEALFRFRPPGRACGPG